MVLQFTRVNGGEGIPNFQVISISGKIRGNFLVMANDFVSKFWMWTWKNEKKNETSRNLNIYIH